MYYCAHTSPTLALPSEDNNNVQGCPRDCLPFRINFDFPLQNTSTSQISEHIYMNMWWKMAGDIPFELRH